MTSDSISSGSVAGLGPSSVESLIRVALRYNGLFLNVEKDEIDMRSPVSVEVKAFVSRLNEIGFSISEELLHALNGLTCEMLASITQVIENIMGVNLNWAPLIKGWDVPTGDSRYAVLGVYFSNDFAGGRLRDSKEGPILQCGHLIPKDLFTLERYNGCPYCGKPFETADFIYIGQGSVLKELRLLTPADMHEIFNSLLGSPAPLDATMRDSLEKLLKIFPLPQNFRIEMKETAMLVIDTLVRLGRESEALALIKTPTDILRYLWYKKTGYVQIIRPRTILDATRKSANRTEFYYNRGTVRRDAKKRELRLKYNRRECLRVARWLNALPLPARQAAEMMHTHRGMWVRMIRALRLGEYSRKKGFEHLAEILDVFYKEKYSTWQGRVDRACEAGDADKTLELLKERPGVFARCLFAMMMRFGAQRVLAAFSEISDSLPLRLLISLSNAAEVYFIPSMIRMCRPSIGKRIPIPFNRKLYYLSPKERQDMANAVENICRESITRRFASSVPERSIGESATIYIEPCLYEIPVSVADRTTSIQSTSDALMGMSIPVEGDTVRIFLHWGEGLPAQLMNMDIACRVIMEDGREDDCYSFNFKCVGAMHSGDIGGIPDKVGTVEYIDLSLPELDAAGAKYVIFVGNAYDVGPELTDPVMGWMNSANPMKISEETGVAYDPSCVRHFVRIRSEYLLKGMAFGVLEVSKRRIIWMELPYMSRSLYGLKSNWVNSLLERLSNKMSVGELLDLKASAQGLTKVDDPDSATESYTCEWALNPAAVSVLLG